MDLFVDFVVGDVVGEFDFVDFDQVWTGSFAPWDAQDQVEGEGQGKDK